MTTIEQIKEELKSDIANNGFPIASKLWTRHRQCLLTAIEGLEKITEAEDINHSLYLSQVVVSTLQTIRDQWEDKA